MKYHNPGVPIRMIFLLLIMFSGVIQVVNADTGSKPSVVQTNPVEQKLTDQQLREKLSGMIQSTSKQLELWRGLKFKHDVAVQFKKPQGNHQKLAGWYESKDRSLVVILGKSVLFSQGTLLHELHHALQDQSWDLQRSLYQGKTRDQQHAIQALIEGEAMLAVAEIMKYDFEVHMQIPQIGEINRDRFEKIFNYGAGLKFVRYHRDKEGWIAVDKIWEEPPKTSAEIFHPEKYLAKPFEVPPLTPVQGDVKKTDQLGEFELRWLLIQDEKSRSQLNTITDKFLGDTWRFVEKQNGQNEEHWDLFFSEATAGDLLLTSCRNSSSITHWRCFGTGNHVYLWREKQENN